MPGGPWPPATVGRLLKASLLSVRSSGKLADRNAPKFTAENYAEYPLIILSQEGKKEIARVTADENGNYRTALPPGAYFLDVLDRVPKRLRARPQPFTVASNQTVRVDMDIDTGIR